MTHDIRTWIDITQSVHICPACDEVLWKSDTRLHLLQHSPPVFYDIEVYLEFSQTLGESNPESLALCEYCNQIFLPKDIQRHIGVGCPGRRPGIESPRYRRIKDPDAIRAAIEHARVNQLCRLLACSECRQVFVAADGFLPHFESDHFKSANQLSLLDRVARSQLSPDIAEIVIRLNQPPADERQVSTPQPQISGIPHTIQVPRPRSRLKSHAGIEDDEKPLEVPFQEDAREAQVGQTTTDEPPVQPPEFSIIELRFVDVLYGAISLPKHFFNFFAAGTNSASLKTHDTSFDGHLEVDHSRIVFGEPLSSWYARNGILAGCYVLLYLPDEEGSIYLRYNRKASTIQSCLLASWDEQAQRVILKYEDVTLKVECSKHLFRSSVNLGDARVLEYMARLHGSIFDVLYLGMRDLYLSGISKVHYVELHNMVIDKRLHPQLGSVAVELSKNTCFKKLGGGYWGFEPDERIERILPQALLSGRRLENIADTRTHPNEDPIPTIKPADSNSGRNSPEVKLVTDALLEPALSVGDLNPPGGHPSEVWVLPQQQLTRAEWPLLHPIIQKIVVRIVVLIRKLANRFREVR